MGGDASSATTANARAPSSELERVMTCHPRHRSPKRENELARARQRPDWPAPGQPLSVWTEYLGVTELFAPVAEAISTAMSKLEPCEYDFGIWSVAGSCRGRRTNYIGVDVARVFPGEVGIVVFLPATDLIGESSVLRLRDSHDWRFGDEHHKGRLPQHRAHTFFLIPSLDYWERYQGDFVKLAADINAAI